MKQLILKTIFIFLFSITNVQAAEGMYPALPDVGEFVIDKTDLLTPTQREKLNNISDKLWQEKQIPIVTIMINSLSSMGAGSLSIERYTQDLFNHWKLGKKERNYGVILLVSLVDRKARIEFGRDWDHRYDSEARDIMQNYIIPRFREGQYSNGVIDGVEAINQLVRGLTLPEVKQPWWVVPLAIGLILLLIGVIISLFKSGRSGWGWALIIGIGLFLWWVMRNAGSGGISGGGSGGGGGSTGSW